jgi:hypothetical protein
MVKCLHTAHFAKSMSCDTGVEGVCCQHIFACKEFEAFTWDYEMSVAFHVADAAVTIPHRNICWALNLKLDGIAMTTSAMNNSINIIPFHDIN